MDTSKNLALVHVGTGVSSVPRDLSPFALFLLALQAQAKTIVANSGHVFYAWPVEQMLADGLALLASRAAAEAGVAFETPDHALRFMRMSLERVLGIGLVLCHETPERAVDAFWQQVVLPLEGGQEPVTAATAPFIASRLWRKPVAQFFAQWIRAAREEGERMKKRVDRVLYNNERDGLMVVDMASFVGHGLHRSFFLSFLSEREDDNAVWVLSRRRALQKTEGLYRALRFIPIEARQIPEEYQTTSVTIGEISRFPCTIEYDWVRTQILLAAVDADPQEETIDISVCVQAIARLRTLSLEEVVHRFMRRLELRKVELSQIETDALVSHVTATARMILNSMEPGMAYDGKPGHVPPHVFVVFRSEERKLTHNEAMNVLLAYKVDDLLPFLRGIPPEDAVRFVQWGKLELSDAEHGEFTADHLAALFLLSGLATETLVAGAVQMHGEARQEAAKMLVHQAQCDSPDVFQPLFDAGLVSVTYDMLEEMPERIPSREIVRFLERFVKDDAEGEMIFAFRDPSQLMELFTRLDARRLRALVAAPESRLRMTQFLYEVVSRLYLGIRAKDTETIQAMQPHVLVFRARIGRAMWEQYMLAAYVTHAREGEYTDGLKPEFRYLGKLPEWTKIPEAIRRDHYPLHRPLNVTLRTLKSVLARHPEDEVFTWVYEAQKDLKKRLRTFRANRTKYYAAFRRNC